MLPIAADSYSLDAFISGVSNGVKGFGLGLFPLGTTFGFEKYIQLFEGESKAEFQIELAFAFNNRTLDSNYDYLTGRPVWAMSSEERRNASVFGNEAWGDRSLSYFNPRSDIDIYLDQGFWKNPLYDEGTLFNIKVGLNARYAMSLEEVSYSLPGHGGLSSPVFVYGNGGVRAPFDAPLPAYPWLSGSRNVYTDYLYLQLSLNMDRDTPTDAEPEEGLSVDFLLEYGPWWLLNNITPEGIQSDFVRAVLYSEQKMEIFSVMQDNGWYWVNMYVGHSDNLSYVWGSAIPENKLTTDRLRGTLQDRVWVHFTGPQFMAGDCYTNIELNLYNTLMFGGVANEMDGRTRAVELQTVFTARFQLKLFGFIRVEYQVGYDFIQGIWPDRPRWWQNSGISFYVSI
ncbi:MAG: hypothetical protein IAA72_03215 [Spirochaetes bacterium]|uniref:Uncharacterized protein n=1 Tax=Candidatus Ornithospirochaeta stercoravium TaxID=2840897 RepID=A0A9D9IA21_9SPIO|nr:hypothetical protein [Candidatus Ornithospirochaeta stercoravium]